MREGWSVGRVVRRSKCVGDEVVIESIGPETDWQAVLEGVDAVIHLAARVHHKHEEHALVHGRSSEGRAPFSEDDVLTPRGLYGMSTAAAEAGMRTLGGDSDMKISVIRPPMVYGAETKGNFAVLTRAVNLGLPMPLPRSVTIALPCRPEPVVVYPSAQSPRCRHQFRDLPPSRPGAALDTRIHRGSGRSLGQEAADVRRAAEPAQRTVQRDGPAGYA
nr:MULTISPECIES: hypothetical protein [unclassified Bradyrhizobium]